MPPKPTKHIRVHRGGSVRIGPLSVITLVVVLCMAVMGVLAVSTANATKAISGRYAASTEEMYVIERAGQEFVADVDAVLAEAREDGSSASAAARAVNKQLDGICKKARAVDERVSCTADVDGSTVSAEFACEDARSLEVAITIKPDATYRIDEWKMVSPQQEAASAGSLWNGG